MDPKLAGKNMLNIVILAAGMGKRMRSALPKVLHPIAGRPMLSHLLQTARSMNPDNLLVVVGHGAEQVREAFSDETDIQFVVQEKQLGTGHAVKQAAPRLQGQTDKDVVLVLYGDVPLVQAETLRALVAAAQGRLALLTEHLDDP